MSFFWSPFPDLFFLSDEHRRGFYMKTQRSYRDAGARSPLQPQVQVAAEDRVGSGGVKFLSTNQNNVD